MEENKKKVLDVLIHGAINSSNFGDVLFAHIFYDTLKNNFNINPCFLTEGRYGISEFNRKELNYWKNTPLIRSYEADALVYMSGGYFGDDKKSIKAYLRRYIRYFALGVKFVHMKKPIIIIGVGGGPLYGKMCLHSAKKIMNHASVITVRDAQTRDYFVNNGVIKPILITADTALTIKSDTIPDLDVSIKDEIRKKIGKRKVLFLHLPNTVDGDRLVLEKIVPAVNLFIENNKNYGVVLGRDCRVEDDISVTNCYRKINTEYKYPYEYNSAYQLCALLDNMDLIVTPKLHVGIVGSAFGKSVVSFPLHSCKTKRFYQQIGESARCVQMSDASVEVIYEMMERFKGQKISIPTEVKDMAEKNIEILKNIKKYI